MLPQRHPGMEAVPFYINPGENKDRFKELKGIYWKTAITTWP